MTEIRKADPAAHSADHVITLRMRITSVEKVFDGTAGSLPFGPALRAAGVLSDRRVIYDAGMLYFALTLCDPHSGLSTEGGDMQ